MYKKLLNIILIFTITLLASCGGKATKNQPTNALERARKNVEEGRGISIGNALKKRGATNYEFSSSNPMWRATLETIDFIPLTTVDYSGGMIITDWYSDQNSSDALKITVRFLTNELRSDAIKIIIHQKKCSSTNVCTVNIIDSKIKNELITSILKKAADLEKEAKK